MRRILPTILALITGKDRYFPRVGIDFQWSNQSWTHNTFRVFELIFGREVGVRFESAVFDGPNDTTILFIGGIEAMIAYAETDIRYALARIPRPRIVKVYIPVLSPVGYAPRISDPYLFAIAFDAATTSSANGVTSRTYAQTCTGSNLMLIAGSRANSSGGTQTVTGVTYAAVGMTQRATYNDPVNFETNDYIHSLANPATGANNVIVSYSGTVNSVCGCSSYSGTNGVGNTGTNNANSGVESVSVTTTEANSYVVGVLYTNGMNPTVSGSTVQRAELQAANGHYINIADLAAGAAGSHALGWTSSSGTWSVLAIEVKALASGPANLKSRDTNLKANIKTIDSNPIANVKSLDTNT